MLSHDPPLIFDMVHDVGEANPLDATSLGYKAALVSLTAAYNAFVKSVAADNVTIANYTEDATCTLLHCVKPCCNVANIDCMC